MKLFILKTFELSDDKYDKIINAIKNLDYELLGFIPMNDKEVWSSFKNYNVYPASKLSEMEYDYLLIATESGGISGYINILTSAGIPVEKLHSTWWLLQQECKIKYEFSTDPDIQTTLKFWDNHEIDIFNQHFAGIESTFNQVYFDKEVQLPCIFFKTIDNQLVKMYYPKNHNFIQHDGKYYVVDILKEQVESSPHLYTTADHEVENGDIVIDCGVCEGNFALRYATIASKIYLFETDPNWVKPLHYTFKPFGNKVEFFNKYVSDKTDDKNIRLDDAISDSWQGGGYKFFLKMDIESAEPSALRGAKKLLTQNDVKASICSYHRFGDELKIKSIFKNLGYKTAVSKGYMFFTWDNNIWDTMDFRRGIVYARK